MNRDHKNMLALGANLRRERTECGLTLKTLSKLGNISKTETGRNVTVVTVWSIGIHPADVMPDFRQNPETPHWLKIGKRREEF